MRTDKNIEVLVIEDEEFDVQRIRKTLQPFANQIHIRKVVSNGHAAVELLEQNSKQYDVVIMDYQIASGLMGENLIRRIKQIDFTLQIIVVTKMTINMTDYEFANKLLDAGATWYCTKYPIDIEDYIYQPTDFILSIFNAFEKKKLEEERLKSNKKLQKNVQDILAKKQLIGISPAIKKLREQIRQCAETDTNILLCGATGTGKELVATNIHYLGKRRFENFMPINCGSLPDNLIESELFGFEKGSFTGAGSRKLGLFEVANHGTVFLDEITELPLSAQSTLLRVIQEGEIDKIGRTRKLQVDVRVIAATNKNLEQEVQEKRFREDLYYRLNVVSIVVPPLTQRREDIPLLIDHFMNLFSHELNRDLPSITEPAMNILVNYHWPGNVRELQNVVQRLLFIGEKTLNEKHIQLALGLQSDPLFQRTSKLWDQDNILPWREMEKKVQREYFQFVRQHTRSDAEAARKLGLAPPNYYRLCKELGLK
ncbi:MAG: sigma-54 dependent transcriptional regulator [candidate division KSB1 bacterium]|nr:sigma-54 dependent transcriptional regulator [candidate division KSB1 bacterium]